MLTRGRCLSPEWNEIKKVPPLQALRRALPSLLFCFAYRFTPHLTLASRKSRMGRDRSPAHTRVVRIESAALERCWQDGWRGELHSLWGWVWGGESNGALIDLPANQHGVIFMYRVVAVLHEHARKFTELHGECHAAARTQAVNVLSSKLPGWD